MTTATMFLAMAVLGVDVGYQPMKDGSLEHIVHVPASTLNALRAGDPVSVLIPQEARNLRASRITFSADTSPAPKQLPTTTFEPTSAPGASATSAGFAESVGSSPDSAVGKTIPIRSPSQFGGNPAASTQPSLSDTIGLNPAVQDVSGLSDPQGLGGAPTDSATGRHKRGDVSLNTPSMSVRSPDGSGSGTALIVPLTSPGTTNGSSINGPNNGNSALSATTAPNSYSPYPPNTTAPMTSGPPNGPVNGGVPNNAANNNAFSNPGPAGPGSGVPPPSFLGQGNSMAPTAYGATSPNYNAATGSGGTYGPSAANNGATGNNPTPPQNYSGNTQLVSSNQDANSQGPNSGPQGPSSDESPAAKPAEPNRIWLFYCLAMGGLLFSNGYLAYMFWDARQRYHAMLGRAFALSPNALGTDPGTSLV